MKKLVLVIFLSSLLKIINAQQICLKVDSIRIISLPRSLKTKLSLIEYDLLNFEPVSLKKDTIILNTSSINEFIIFLEKIEDYSILPSSLDIRMLIFIYYNKDIVLKVSVDSLGNFQYLGNVYCSEQELVNWIKKNVNSWQDLR